MRRIGGRKGKTVLVHRLAWEEAYGPIPPGIDILHHCDNPPCYEIAHLFAGDATTNALDMIAKGRMPGTGKTHCKQGHSLSGDNLRLSQRTRPSGRPSIQRVCRACSAASTIARRAQRKARGELVKPLSYRPEFRDPGYVALRYTMNGAISMANKRAQYFGTPFVIMQSEGSAFYIVDPKSAPDYVRGRPVLRTEQP